MAAESGCDDRSEGHTAPCTPMRLVDPQLRDASATEPSEHEAHSPDQDEHGLVCGLAGWTPSWLQRFATVNTYTVLWGLLGMAEIAINSYLGAIINTLEKSFELTTTTSGVILAAFEVSMLVCTVVLNYLGSRGHKPRWVAAGAAVLGVACFSRLVLYLALGPGRRALALTREHGVLEDHLSTNSTAPAWQLCGAAAPAADCPRDSAADVTAAAADTLGTPALLLVASQLLMGAGASLPLSLGIAYMDDNAPRNKAPLLIAASQFVRMLGPTVGYLLASYSLSRFVAPGLTPLIDETDPRWIGAWWIGWAPLSALALLLAVPLMLFPREMPATRQRSSKSPRRVLERSLADFWKSTRRLLGNRLMMCNIFSSVLFMFGMSGSWAYMPKYMETHFQQSASTSSLVLGSFGLVSTALGLAASGVVIWWFQPRPRSLAAWNVVVELIDAFVRVGWAFIACEDDYMSGARSSDGRWNMTSDCNNACSCGPHVTFSPVCDEGSGDTYFSPCHAGCNDSYVINGTTVFGNCSCLPGSGTATAGPCPTDCASVFIAFLVTQSVLQCLEASGRAGNALLHFRCVDEIDKAQAVAFAEVMMTGFAYIPAPIIYGMIIDSSCLVWSETCGSRGNCWLYDMAHMRHAPNILAAGFLFSGTFLDIGVWYYAKDVRLYDEDENVGGGEDRDLKLSTLAAALS
ncbi:solute carrier organic anion transporter family member 74D-like isoform X1 [Schistocerca piceifrons]|uniref:solute carrier organic anion transporter family member 74D-like isoform X1 n=1 Tax=Schistocerca piceifrons TaxID=274613 RepID=UPI001F5F9143|nr:solute carrier organic anion transporter family member 74D-like isoform X1 [Schistocerca piceifrons]